MRQVIGKGITSLGWDCTYLSIAKLISAHSYANRSKVGAILVKDKRIISIGYNGTPSGFDNECEVNGVTKREVLHAESNCISKCAMSNESSKGSTLYTTMSPCFECAKLIIQCGIERVVYQDDYSDLTGIELLKKASIDVTKI